MPKVHFGIGPFAKYVDGHPPEKETEEERRRYRKGPAMLRARALSVWSLVSSNPRMANNPNQFAQCHQVNMEQDVEASTVSHESEGCRLSPPRICDSFDSCEGSEDVGKKSGSLKALMLPSRPPHLCRDSVMSFDEPVTPRPTKDLDNDLEAVLRGYELEEVNMEALWSSSSEEWTPEQNDEPKPETSGEVVASVEWTPNCFNVVLAALRWQRGLNAIPGREDKDIHSALAQASNPWWLRDDALQCCRNMRKIFGDLMTACAAVITFKTFKN